MKEQGVEISSTQSIIDDARNGKMFILVDHEERENEGDLVIPGQMATPNAVNFICLLYTSPSPRDPSISRMPSSA